MFKFECQKCGSEDLIYRSWVLRMTDVLIKPETEHIEYGPHNVEEDCELGAEFGFACKVCGHRLHIGQMDVADESDLRQYLNRTLEEISAENENYHRYLEEQLQQQERELMASLSETGE